MVVFVYEIQMLPAQKTELAAEICEESERLLK